MVEALADDAELFRGDAEQLHGVGLDRLAAGDDVIDASELTVIDAPPEGAEAFAEAWF